MPRTRLTVAVLAVIALGLALGCNNAKDINLTFTPTCTPTGAEVCDGEDNDCDGEFDEGFDADGDGVTTCGADGQAGTVDDDCNDDPAAGGASVFPGATEDCTGGVDEDCDNQFDCDDAGCAGDAACTEGANCDNAEDDDGDGCVDGADSDCGGTETDCGDGEDDDCDGAMDCADDDCADAIACDESANCADEVDNDGDGCVDGADSDCGGMEQSCTDGDDDCDGMSDCDDSDCDGDPACQSAFEQKVTVAFQMAANNSRGFSITLTPPAGAAPDTASTQVLGGIPCLDLGSDPTFVDGEFNFACLFSGATDVAAGDVISVDVSGMGDAPTAGDYDVACVSTNDALEEVAVSCSVAVE